MKTLFKIAFRNVVRNGRRTMLTVLTMTVGIGFFIAMDSLMGGMDGLSLDNMASLNESSVKVRTQGYFEEANAFPLEKGIEDPEAVSSKIAGVKGVLGVAPRTKFIAELSNYLESKPVVGTVLDPTRDGEVFSLRSFVKGAWLSPEGKNEILLGTSLAREFGLELGSSLTLSARMRAYPSEAANGSGASTTEFDDYSGAQNADEFTIVGILDTTDPNLNGQGVFISYSAADSLLDLRGLVTELDVKVSKRWDTKSFLAEGDRVRDGVKAALPGFAVLSLNDMSAGFMALLRQKASFSYVIILIILLIAAVGIVNTVLMSVYSRIREIGVLRAFGIKRGETARLFILEGGILGTIGAAAGVAFGALLDTVMIYVGIPLEALAGKIDTAGMPIWGTIYGQWNFGSMIFGFVFGVLVALAASWIPARKASRLEVSGALRFV